jgi:hypothetical protein
LIKSAADKKRSKGATQAAPSEAPKRRGRPPGSKNKTTSAPRPAPSPDKSKTEQPKTKAQPMSAPKATQGKKPNVIKTFEKGGFIHITDTYPPSWPIREERRAKGFEWSKEAWAWLGKNSEQAREQVKKWGLTLNGEVLASELVSPESKAKRQQEREQRASGKPKTDKPKAPKAGKKNEEGVVEQIKSAASSVVDGIKEAMGGKKERKARKPNKPRAVKLPKTWAELECMSRAQLERMYPAAVGKDAPSSAKPKMLREQIAAALGISIPDAGCEKKGRVTVNMTAQAKTKLMQGGPASRRVRDLLIKEGIERGDCNTKRRGCGKGKKAA